MADLDIDSERFRCIGSARFTVYAIKNMLRKRFYKGTLKYQGYPCDANGRPLSSPATGDSDATAELLRGSDGTDVTEWRALPDTNFIFIWALNVAMGSEESLPTPSSLPDDGWIHLLYCTEDCSRLMLTKIMLSLENGTQLK